MFAVAEAAGDAAVELDEAVDRLGAAVVGAAGVEVGQNASRHCFRVFPSRFISGIGRVSNDRMRSSAIRRPSSGLVALGRPELLRAQPRHGTSSWRSSTAIARSSRARCRSVSFSAPQRRIVRIP